MGNNEEGPVESQPCAQREWPRRVVSFNNMKMRCNIFLTDLNRADPILTSQSVG